MSGEQRTDEQRQGPLSDEAIIRQWLEATVHPHQPFARPNALAALARLAAAERALEEARRELAQVEQQRQWRANERNRAEERADGVERQLVEAREALGEIHHEAQKARVGGPRMDGSEQFSSPRFKTIRDIARAALEASAAEATGPRPEQGETWDCGCPFEGPHTEACSLGGTATAVPDVEGRRAMSATTLEGLTLTRNRSEGVHVQGCSHEGRSAVVWLWAAGRPASEWRMVPWLNYCRVCLPAATSDGDQAVAPSSASPVSRGAAPSSGEERG